MSLKFPLLLASVISVSVTALVPASLYAQTGQTLSGLWRQDDGSVTVRVAPCSNSKNWCATVVEERLQPGEPSLLNQMVVRDMKPNGKKGWKGKYVVDGQSMSATAKMLRADTISFKICAIAFVCDTIRLKQVPRS
jgi:uncharacterized protein (DUF2147 family)